MFDNIATLTVAGNVSELYHSVIVDTPLAPYFHECLSEEDLDEMNIEIIRNTLYKVRDKRHMLNLTILFPIHPSN